MKEYFFSLTVLKVFIVSLMQTLRVAGMPQIAKVHQVFTHVHIGYEIMFAGCPVVWVSEL
jgi:hypothetical protein